MFQTYAVTVHAKMRVIALIICDNACMNITWDEMRTVLTLVREGTLQKAGAALGVNYTTIARRVARAESAMGEVLFDRLADGYSPTQTAQLVARHAETMEASEHALMREIAGRDQTLSGPLVVTAPQLLIAHFLAPAIETFIGLHPEVDLQFRAANELLDLNRREADLAIRISRNPGDTLKGLRLSEQASGVFATRNWAWRIEDEPNATLDWIIYDRLGGLSKQDTDALPGSRVRLKFDDMVAMIGAARAGLGLIRAPLFLGRAFPDLVRIDAAPLRDYPDVWLVGHADVWPSAKVTALRNVLVRYFRENRDTFVQ